MADRGIQLQDKNGDKLYPLTTTENVYSKDNKNLDEFIRRIDNLYPAGSIYLSVNNVSPASLFGGTWEALEEGYALWTTTTSGQGGNTISAGLPNITGNITPSVIYYAEMPSDGVFSTSAGASATYTGINSLSRQRAVVNFNANRSSSVYRDDVTTVQPPAVKLYAWKRIS